MGICKSCLTGEDPPEAGPHPLDILRQQRLQPCHVAERQNNLPEGAIIGYNDLCYNIGLSAPFLYFPPPPPPQTAPPVFPFWFPPILHHPPPPPLPAPPPPFFQLPPSFAACNFTAPWNGAGGLFGYEPHAPARTVCHPHHPSVHDNPTLWQNYTKPPAGNPDDRRVGHDEMTHAIYLGNESSLYAPQSPPHAQAPHPPPKLPFCSPPMNPDTCERLPMKTRGRSLSLGCTAPSTPRVLPDLRTGFPEGRVKASPYLRRIPLDYPAQFAQAKTSPSPPTPLPPPSHPDLPQLPPVMPQEVGVHQSFGKATVSKTVLFGGATMYSPSSRHSTPALNSRSKSASLQVEEAPSETLPRSWVTMDFGGRSQPPSTVISMNSPRSLPSRPQSI